MSDNPCLSCSINQDCCSNLLGLRLSQREFDAHFAHHADALTIKRDGAHYQVTAKAGPCPNWQGRCTVYDTRPMECRLYPGTVSVVAAVGDNAIAVVHDRTPCPQKALLRPSNAAARALIEGFLRDIYGPDVKTHVVFDAGAGRAAAAAIKAANRLTRLAT